MSIINEIYPYNPKQTSPVVHLYRLQNEIGKIYCTFAPRYKKALYYDKD